MTKEEIVDKLKRAYEMEEVMAGMLFDVIRKILPISELSEDKQKRVAQMLMSIQKDTLKHEKMVFELIEQWSRK